MPANLPPAYFEAEKRLKNAPTAEEKVAAIEELISIIPKHKGTEKLLAMYKTKMAKLKNAAQKKSGAARHGAGHKVRKSGAGQVIVIGAPNAGKSQLIKSLTGTEPAVSPNPYTTHDASPAMMKYKNIQIQLVDTPPVTADYMEDWFPDLVRGSNGVIMLIDLAANDALEAHQAILEKLRAKRIDFSDWQQDTPGAVEPGRSCKKTLTVGNKNDLLADNELLALYREELEPEFTLVPVSASSGEGMETLRKDIYTMLNIIRVYSKIPGKKAEMKDPFTLPVGSTVMDMARAVHKDFSENLKFARIWGNNSYDGQRVNRGHVLEDEDMIELHM
jgi:small GTP-binding protein